MVYVKPTVNVRRSQELYTGARQYAPGGAPCNKCWPPAPLSHPLYIKRAKGARIVDVDDNEYIDYWCGAGPIILGHGHPEVDQAVIDMIQENGVQFAIPHPYEIELARKLREVVPCAEMSTFCNAGTDGISFAVRLARAYTERPIIVKFEGSYQGWADSVVASSHPSSDKWGPDDAPSTVVESTGVLPEVIARTLVLPYNNLDAVTEHVEHLRSQIAGIIVEPMVASSNLLPKPGFLQGLRQLCDAYGIVLIFDEVVTGFRHGLAGGQGVWGVTPDVAVFGKAMANGYVIAALSGKKEYMGVLTPGPALASGTYNGNPVSSAAALKTIEVLGRPGFYERLFRLGDTLRAEVNREAEKLGVRARCDGYGSVWCLYFDAQRPENYRDVARYWEGGGAQKYEAYRSYMLNHELFLCPYRPHCFIAGAHTEEDIQRTADATAAFLKEHRSALR